MQRLSISTCASAMHASAQAVQVKAQSKHASRQSRKACELVAGLGWRNSISCDWCMVSSSFEGGSVRARTT